MISEYLEKYKKEFKQLIEDIKHKDTFYKQIPNLLTLSRAVGIVPVNILFFTGNVILALILMALIASTDIFDGKIARKYDIQSKFGADLDAVCDKIMFAGFAVPLLVSNPLLIINFVLEGIIASINVYGRMKGLDTKTVYSGKIKTVALSSTLILGYLSQFYGMWQSLVGLFSVITGVTQLVAIKDYITECIKMNNEFNEKQAEEISLDGLCGQSDDFSHEEVLVPEKNISNLESLKQARTFILASVEPGKVYTGKKRLRTMLQEKKSN